MFFDTVGVFALLVQSGQWRWMICSSPPGVEQSMLGLGERERDIDIMAIFVVPLQSLICTLFLHAIRSLVSDIAVVVSRDTTIPNSISFLIPSAHNLDHSPLLTSNIISKS
jgi:hypothetical protein